MTWRHVALIAIAASMVLVCSWRGEACAASMPRIIEAATLIIVGVLAHARNGDDRGPKP